MISCGLGPILFSCALPDETLIALHQNKALRKTYYAARHATDMSENGGISNLNRATFERV